MTARHLILPLLCFGAPFVSPADDTLADYKPLLENSPFISQAFKERLANAAGGGIKNLSFNGYTRIDGEWQLCFIKKKDKLAIWAEVGDTLEGFTIKAFAPGKQAVTLEKAGISTTIKMDKPK